MKTFKNLELVDGIHGTGAQIDKQDLRDFAFSAPAVPFDWDLGFDIELLLGFRQVCANESEFFGSRGRAGWGVDRYREIVAEVRSRNIPPFIIPPKDQGASSSCTGQGVATYLSVLNMIETGVWVKISARDIYAYVSLGKHRGAQLRDAIALPVERGVATEELVPTMVYYDAGGQQAVRSMTEDEYLEKPIETDVIKAIRIALQSKEYGVVVNFANGEEMMEQTAWATLLNFGCYFGVVGENNQTWGSENPQAPKLSNAWGHALYNGKALKIQGVKKTRHINSWGNGTGANGWQNLGVEYYNNILNGQRSVFNPWTLVDKSNINSTLITKTTMIKEKGKPAVYVLVDGVAIPFATNWETYQKDFSKSKITELSSVEFKKYKVATGVVITRK